MSIERVSKMETFKFRVAGYQKDARHLMCETASVDEGGWSRTAHPCVDVVINKSEISAPLILFLMENLDGEYMASSLTINSCKITLHNDNKTEADYIRESGQPHAENMIRAYKLDEKIPSFNYIMPRIAENWGFMEYMELVVGDILKKGTTRIEIKGTEYKI